MSNLSIVRSITSKVGQKPQHIRCNTASHRALQWAYRAAKGEKNSFSFNNFGHVAIVKVRKANGWLTVSVDKEQPELTKSPLVRHNDQGQPMTRGEIKYEQNVFNQAYSIVG